MNNILTISKREITRLRSRFRGRSRVILLFIIGLSIVISYLISQHGFTLNKVYNPVLMIPLLSR